MPKEQVEEYVEAIFDIAGEKGTAKTTEVANRLDNAPASVLAARGTAMGHDHEHCLCLAHGRERFVVLPRTSDGLEMS